MRENDKYNGRGKKNPRHPIATSGIIDSHPEVTLGLKQTTGIVAIQKNKEPHVKVGVRGSGLSSKLRQIHFD